MNSNQTEPPLPHVLLAEDDADLGRIICVLLERAGFTVTHTEDGNNAWLLAQNQSFDVFVLDVDLPDLNGIEVCQRLKRIPALKDRPVLLFSGQLDLPEMAKLAGADDFLEKPAGLLLLADRLRTLLEKHRLRPKQPWQK